LIRFGEEEDRRLAASMPPREITLCEDETFHPQICLVPQIRIVSPPRPNSPQIPGGFPIFPSRSSGVSRW
jgi:hypothetical protein